MEKLRQKLTSSRSQRQFGGRVKTRGDKTENRNRATAECWTGALRLSSSRTPPEDRGYLSSVVLCIQTFIQKFVEGNFTKDLQFSYIS